MIDTSAITPVGDEARFDGLGRALQHKPIWRLLQYVGPHRKYAFLTAGFGVLGFLLSFVFPWLIGSTVDVIAHGGSAGTISAERQRLILLAGLTLLTGVGEAVALYGRSHFNVHLSDAIVTDLRRALFNHLQRLSVHFYTKERIGSILSRILHDVREATALIYSGIIVAALDAVQLLLAIVLLSQLSWKLTLACVAVFPLYAVMFVTRNPRVRLASERLHEKLCEISGNVAEVLSGQALVKTCTAELREAERFAADVNEHHRLVVAQSHEGHVVASLGDLLVSVGTTIVIGYGGWLALRGELTAGTLTRYVGYVAIMYGPVRRFAELNMTYQSSLSAMRRVFRVFEIHPAVAEPPCALESAPAEGDVRFEDVWFRYGDDTEETRMALDEVEVTENGTSQASAARPASDRSWVLRGVALHARRGERVAVVGLSGAGKTTLLSLLPRLYDVSSGRVLVDGIDVRAYGLRALRGAIAVVQQESFLFTGTIFENIAYGRPDASEREVVLAAKAAHAHEFIQRFPDGYGSRLGERGVNLSGGQRQRLSIARALVKDPRILILDEATSSLDVESERLVQLALETLMQGRTSFIIAHRLSTIRSADRILVIEHGRVAECGSHEELLRRTGPYYRLVAAQGSELAETPQVKRVSSW